MSWSPKRHRPVVPVAPQADVSLVFDGGSLGNPGKGYGSYVFRGSVSTPVPIRVEFEGRRTNNEAEYMTLIHALHRLIQDLERDLLVPRDVSINVLSDSKLVVEQVNGRWKVRHPGLQPLQREAVELLKRFGTFTISWHPRLESVRILGH